MLDNIDDENDSQTVINGVKFVSNAFRSKDFEVPQMDNYEMRIYLETIAGIITGISDIIKQKDKSVYDLIERAVENLSLR